VKISVNRRSGSNRAKSDCKLLRERVGVVDPVGVGFDCLEVTNATLVLFTSLIASGLEATVEKGEGRAKREPVASRATR
jgi:hypothetical protein